MSDERSKHVGSRDEEKREAERKAKLRAESQDSDLTEALDDSFPAPPVVDGAEKPRWSTEEPRSRSGSSETSRKDKRRRN